MRVDINVVDDPGGQELCDRFGPERGLPAWSFLDADRRVLADSLRDGTNVGFPYEPHEVAHFLAALRKARPDFTDDEIQLLKDRLGAIRKAQEQRAREQEKDVG